MSASRSSGRARTMPMARRISLENSMLNETTRRVSENRAPASMAPTPEYRGSFAAG